MEGDMDLKEFRDKHNLSRKELANHLGVVISYIADIENGKKKISEKLVYKLKELEQEFDTEWDLSNINYGHKIRAFRDNTGMSRKDLGSILHISEDGVTRIETNKSKLGKYAIDTLADQGLNLSWLIGNSDNMAAEFNSQKYYLDRIKIGGNIEPVDKESARQYALENKFLPQYYTEGDNYDDTVLVPFLNVTASAGEGFINIDNIPDSYRVRVSARLLGLAPTEIDGGYFIKARGNSMTPQIDNGDLLFVKDVQDTPRYLEGIYIVNYDGEIYVKDIQLSNDRLVMRSINKNYEDIIIQNMEESDIYVKIIAKVIKVIKDV